MFSNLNLPVASPLQFLGRYLFRRSEVEEANPLKFKMRFTPTTYYTTDSQLFAKPWLAFIPSLKVKVFCQKKDKIKIADGLNFIIETIGY